MTSPWPLVNLGQVLTYRKEFVTIADTTEYKRCRVQLHAKGVVLRDVVPGGLIKTKKQQVCRESDFLVAEIDAKVGGFGMVPYNLHGAIVSSHYFLYSVNRDCLLPEFLGYFVRTAAFRDQVTARGSTNYAAIRPHHVLGYQIPLPPVSDQQRIANTLDRISMKVKEAVRLRDHALREQDALLLSAFQRIAHGAERLPLGHIAPLQRRQVSIRSDGEYRELGVRSFGRGTFHKPTLRGSELTWQKLFLVRSGDIVLSNIKAWEGAIAVAQSEDDERVGSHRYLTCVPIAGRATSTFVCFYLLTAAGLLQVSQASPGSADRNRTLGMNALQNIGVPVPSYCKQLWFDNLWNRIARVRRVQVEQLHSMEAILPATFDQAFKGEWVSG